VAALFATGVGGVATARVHRPVPCPGGKIVARSPEAYAFGFHNALYACVNGARHARFITAPDRDFFGDPRVPRALVSGHWVVFTHVAVSHCADWYVYLADARSGIVWHRSLPAGLGTNFSPSNGCVGRGGPLTAAAVRDDGAMAYINGPVDGKDQGTHDTYEVMLVDWSGTRSVAAGADINPRQITISGNTVTWLQAGQPRTAELAPVERPPRTAASSRTTGHRPALIACRTR
jgi:hypothetical protein